MTNDQHRILVVDDQQAVCYSLKRFLVAEGYAVLTATSGEQALACLEGFRPDLVITDVKMPEMDGLELLHAIKEHSPDLQVILITAYSTTDKAIEAMKLGAYDYLLKPFDNATLLGRIQEAIRAKEMMADVVSFDNWEQVPSGERIIGKSPEMLAVYKQIGKAAPSDATVLIQGESGTGKELVARAIYHHSRRTDKPFLAINCAALPEQLLESELFGFEQGAFTGADFKRVGKFEQCHGGTIFLDEIGEMSLATQAKLLRVLQDGSFQRLGGTETVTTDVRIIAATNRDLAAMVAKGDFREDLFYRIHVVAIQLPPLRDRRGDIKELITHFIRKYNRLLHKQIKGIRADTLRQLESYHWPGNVRELENVVQKGMVLCAGDYLSIECLAPPRRKRYHAMQGSRRGGWTAGDHGPGAFRARIVRHPHQPARKGTGPPGPQKNPRQPGAGRQTAGYFPQHPPQEAQRVGLKPFSPSWIHPSFCHDPPSSHLCKT